MCYGDQITFLDCGHQKITLLVECFDGWDESGNCRVNDVQIIRRNFGHAPSLCVYCYRRHVDDIIGTHEAGIARYDRLIEELTRTMRAILDAPGREELKRLRTDCEVKRGDLVDRRFAELEEFRLQQGVWGDGGPYKGYKPSRSAA
ncbi:MAG: hypothetical protein Q9220_006906 [cf. Caloplaca sp. 1 TL-2023]